MICCHNDFLQYNITDPLASISIYRLTDGIFNFDHKLSGCHTHSGPLHHNFDLEISLTFIPLVEISAGFLLVGT